MPEGLSASEVGKEIIEHRQHAESSSRHDLIMTMIEATMLAAVAVLAAWSGYAAAKWSTESSLHLAQSAKLRAQASREDLTAEGLRNLDAATFNAWFAAFILDKPAAADVATRRFRPEFKVAFDAWLATNPATNPDAPQGPTYMPEYKQPEADHAADLDAQADALYSEGADNGHTADEYVRLTVVMASVLFLVGISGHFKIRIVRYFLVGVGAAILTGAIVLLITAPKPPT